MNTVHEVSRLAGISVRTLHYYDAIGLLKPAQTTEAGYRLYDEASLTRLQSILLFREAGFSLREIAAILDAPDFDLREALQNQLRLLELRREQLDRLIGHTRNLLEKGEKNMDFSAFDKTAQQAYTEEVKRRWGNTEEYRESSAREAARTDEQNGAAADALAAVFARFGAIRGSTPSGAEAQSLVGVLQDCITENWYPCTKEILSSLGAMYSSDDRFRASIDRAGGEGTAAFAAEAIRIFTA